MEGKIIDGKKIAGRIKEEVKKGVEELRGKGIRVTLHSIMVGDNPASKVYVRNQRRGAEEVGIEYNLHEFPEDISQSELIGFIEKLNDDREVSGIILQVPVPPSLNAREIQLHISPSKDVEGVNPYNMGLLLYGRGRLLPCTPRAAMILLQSTGVPLKGKEVTLVGHSEIVGKPLALMLLESLYEAPTPTVCHIATRDLSFHTRRADILIVAVGKAGLIRGDMIKEGAVVIDIGINRVKVKDEEGKEKFKIVGDVVFEEALEKVSFITPVPGGVGPVTTAVLLQNTLEAARIGMGGEG